MDGGGGGGEGFGSVGGFSVGGTGGRASGRVSGEVGDLGGEGRERREGVVKGNVSYTSERELKQYAMPVPIPVLRLVEKYILPLARLHTDD